MYNQISRTRSIVEVSLFAAIVFILAFTPFIGYIPLGFTKATTVHIPVIIASIILGPKRGAIIGFMFGLTSLIVNTFVNPSITSFVFSPFYSFGYTKGNIWSLFICFVPRILVGVVPYYVYNGVQKIGKKSEYLSLVLAGLSGSLTNTILVMGSIGLFFGNSYIKAIESNDAFIKIIASVVCINGVPEAIVASILTLGICKALVPYRKRRIA